MSGILQKIASAIIMLAMLGVVLAGGVLFASIGLGVMLAVIVGATIGVVIWTIHDKWTEWKRRRHRPNRPAAR